MRCDRPLLLCTWMLVACSAVAQDMEPRRWTHLPVGTNILGVGYLYTGGEVTFDPVLQIEDAEVELSTVVLQYNRYFSLLDATARLDVRVPFHRGRWDGLLEGQPASTTRTGFGDPTLRLSVNLLGAPALEPDEFFEFREQNPTSTVLGTALAVRFPLGDYDGDKLINLGQNRFVVEPQLGVLHTRGPWSFEVTGTLSLYTDNDEFFGGNELEQDPLFAAQAHVVRTFESRWWVSVGASYGWAGSSEINNLPKDDDKSSLLGGLSFGLPIGATQGVRVTYFRSIALDDIGTDAHNVLIGWSLRF